MAAHAAPQITAITPAQIPYGHAATVTVTVAEPAAGMQLALLPGSAYQSAAIALPQTTFVASLATRNQLLAASAHELVVVDVRHEPPQVVTRKPLAAGARLFSASADFAVFVDTGMLVHVIDLHTTATLHELAPLQVTGTIRDLTLDQHTLYVLLETGQVLTADVTQPSAALHVLGKLSATTERIVVQAGVCYSTAPGDGLSIAGCGTAGIKPRAKFFTSGQIRDLRVAGQIAYLADGPMGLTLVDVADPAQPRLLGSNNKLGDVEHVALGAGRALVSTPRGDVLLVDITRPGLPLLISSFRTERAPAAIAWDDGDAWLATPQGAQRIDFHAEAAALISDEGVNLGGSRRGFINDNTLYVSDWFSGLHIYDITNPNDLRHLGNFHTPGSSKGVVVRDGIAFVGDDDHGVQIIDVSDPAKPMLLSNIPTPGLAYTMKLAGTLLYIADHRGGLHIADISDVRAPRVLGSYDTPGKAWAVEVRGQYAFVADDASGLLVLDVSDARQPRLIGQFAPGGAAEDVRLRDNYAFVTFFDQGLFVLDISDPAAPRAAGQIAIPGNARGIDLQGNYAYVAAWEAGLQIVDIGDVTQPRIAGYYDSDGSAWGVNVRGDYAYVLDWWGGVKSVDIRTAQAPRLAVRYHARAPVRDVVLAQRYALTAADSAGLQIYDINNPLNPIWATGVDLPAAATSVAYANDTGYVATAAGIAVIDLHDPSSARLLHLVNMKHAVRTVRAAGSRVFVLDDTGKVYALDATHRYLTAVASEATDLWIDSKKLFIARGAHGFAVYALNADRPPHLTEDIDTASPVVGIRAQGDLIVAALLNQTLAVLTHHQSDFVLRALYPLSDACRDFHLIDHTLYISSAHDELQVIDLTNSTQPRLHARYPGTRQITRFAVRDNQVFFAGENKLSSVKLLPNVLFTRSTESTFTALVPANEPLGNYDLALMSANNSTNTRHNALQVTLNTGKKPQLSAEQFQRLLEQQKALHNGTR
ncbi:MAG: hypothetical protein HY273_03580 [Gammaproteobacteria bacterium]|nr:hypothetical protein [Gammaproteobacteria bacterium]